MITSLAHNVVVQPDGYEGHFIAVFSDGTIETGTVTTSLGSALVEPSVPYQGTHIPVGYERAMKGIRRFKELEKLAIEAGIQVGRVSRWDVDWQGNVIISLTQED